MKVEQRHWTPDKGWGANTPGELIENADLVLVFGKRELLNESDLLAEIRAAYPKALLTGCSTAGEIHDTRVYDDAVVTTAVQFDHTKIAGAVTQVANAGDSAKAGKYLALAIPHEDLAHVFVLSDGLSVNGSELVDGLVEHLPKGVTVTGGLAGDGGNFEETCVIWDGKPEKNSLVLVGFYGDRLKIGYGSKGGWDTFGADRLITRSHENVLYELDGQSALELYKKYLGDHAEGLPATGLLFPLSIHNGNGNGEAGVVRTILAVDENDQSLTFAGDIPQGSYARLMKANINRLIDGAMGAAQRSCETAGELSAELAILISCVGRKMVLKQRVEEEVEGVREILGTTATLAGFYSYGEISPFISNAKCELHNQTMTVTTFSEH